MPPRFDPRPMSTQKLKDLAAQLVEDIIQLEHECNKRFAHWCRIGIFAPQGAQDIAHGACRNARRNRTRAFNIRTQVMEELMNRERQELRAMDAVA